MTDIARNIKRLRNERCLSQEQLADQLGVTRQTVSDWERGVSFPDLATLERIAQVFATSVDSLIYPVQAARSSGQPGLVPLPARFVFWSIIVFLILYYAGIWAISLVLQPGVEESYRYADFWSIILIVSYISACTCILSTGFNGGGRDNDNSRTDEK